MLRRTFLSFFWMGATALSTIGVAIPVKMEEALSATSLLPPVYPFKWWFSYDGEMYTEECNSKEEALRLLANYGEGLIAECQRKDYDLSVGGDSIMELLYGQNEDAIGEGEFLDGPTSEQVNDLGKMVSNAIDLWVHKHKIDTSAWIFGTIRNVVKFDELK